MLPDSLQYFASCLRTPIESLSPFLRLYKGKIIHESPTISRVIFLMRQFGGLTTQEIRDYIKLMFYEGSCCSQQGSCMRLVNWVWLWLFERLAPLLVTAPEVHVLCQSIRTNENAK